MNSILDQIGNTPFYQLQKLPENQATIFAKLEMFNPGGSVKDRIALFILNQAEKQGKIHPGSTIIEPTSGNTGIGLALVSSVRKYRLILVMPENYSRERRFMMKAFGAEIVLTPENEEMPGAIRKAEALAKEIPDSFLLRQFENPLNALTHEETTAEEIFRELAPEKIDALVLGVGTGGTITGIGRALKKRNPAAKIVAVEPASAAVLSGGKPHLHKIQGIGAGFVPPILDRSLMDQIETVSDDEAYQQAKKLSREQGILAGISSGAAFAASLRLAQQLGRGKNIVTVFPDKGERYFSIEKYFKGE